jgi:tetratricopeptide (TPR) repeat protein
MMGCNGNEISLEDDPDSPAFGISEGADLLDSIDMTESSPDLTPRSLKDAAEVAIEQGDAGKAGSLLEQALESMRSGNHRDGFYAQVAIARADLYWGAQDLESASALYLEALEILESEFGEKSEVVAICVRNLGEIYKDQGDATRASHFKKRWQHIMGRQS